MSIAEQFEQKIHAGKLAAPIPRWVVVVKRVGLWVAFGLLIVLGTASAGVSVWFILDPAVLVMDAERVKYFESLLEVLPLFWAVTSLLCGLGAVWIFTRSTHGYRYRLMAVGSACLVAFLSLGAALASAGIADKIEALADFYVPKYEAIAQPRTIRFMQPAEGTIIGRIYEMNTSTWEIDDPRGEEWRVDISVDTHLPPKNRLQIGTCVHVLGSASTTVKATEAQTVILCPRGVHLRQIPPPSRQPPPPPPDDRDQMLK